MDSNSQNSEYVVRPIGERVTALETKFDNFETRLQNIEGKLDDLLTLKAKGMGAIGLVSILVGSGVLGVIVLVLNFFSNRGH